MTSAQHALSLVLDRSTVSSLYPPARGARSRERKIPLSPEILEVLPARVRSVIRKSLGRGGMEAFLLDSEEGLHLIIRNKRRY